MHGLHCNLSKIHAVTSSDPRMIFFERALRISSNNDKVLGLVVYSCYCWGQSFDSCGSQWLLTINFFILHKCSL